MKIKSHFSAAHRAFTLIEVMVAMALLSLIVLALMAVFNNTQAAFRASVTQTDVLEGGRAAMDLITGDLRAMSPSLGLTAGYTQQTPHGYYNPPPIPPSSPGYVFVATSGAVNFYEEISSGYVPLVQSLVGASNPNIMRTNTLENIFILSRQNQTWTGVGYVVNSSPTNSGNSLYPLYRFSMSTNLTAINGPQTLYNTFMYNVNNGIFTNMSHLLDGVVNLTAKPYTISGTPIIFLTNNIITYPLSFAYSLQPVLGCTFYSNALPASVEIEMATLEDRPLQRAESFPTFQLQTNYLASQAGKVHVFRQRVAIPNVDPSVYQ